MKDKIIIVIFLVYIFAFSIMGVIFRDSEISYTERRYLTSFPEFSFDNDYINKLDKYFLDHFPYRDEFRSLKAYFNYDILNMFDNNGIYLKDNYIFKTNYPTNYKSIVNFISYINKTKKLLNKNNNVFIMIIPDKNYYLNDANFLNIDYTYIYNKINDLNIKNIDIRDIMSLEDYYETDTHWRQEKLDKVLIKMNDIMSFNYKNIEYNKNIYDKFYGVYYGESAINRDAEELIYLTNDNILSLEVNYLENDNLYSVYNFDNLTGMDSYEVYLDGASSFIEIYNNNSSSSKELVIFRDSFASSITPLIANYYKKITLIDNRYINSDNYLKRIDFNNQDVLFMYSSLIVNNSFSLKG